MYLLFKPLRSSFRFFFCYLNRPLITTQTYCPSFVVLCHRWATFWDFDMFFLSSSAEITEKLLYWNIQKQRHLTKILERTPKTWNRCTQYWIELNASRGESRRRNRHHHCSFLQGKATKWNDKYGDFVRVSATGAGPCVWAVYATQASQRSRPETK